MTEQPSVPERTARDAIAEALDAATRRRKHAVLPEFTDAITDATIAAIRAMSAGQLAELDPRLAGGGA